VSSPRRGTAAGGGAVGGIDFGDEDVLQYEGGSGTWSMAFDASSADPSWADADLASLYLPKPGAGVSLVSIACLLAALAKRRVTALEPTSFDRVRGHAGFPIST